MAEWGRGDVKSTRVEEREIEAWESEKQTKTARKERASESEREMESGEERRWRK